ncbi:MAG TPA: ATP-binding protein [Flavobacterium sp.]|jgi:predicted AAA+ superfamily ATPase|nr:ATP-binding protein [Flavobacterium sp.]HQV36748.1 ATP-binding protein [Flavobacterium sp.]HQX02633.1 ATP-binding protein [Flavobacterium sp.]HRZ30996.1 ATP-binding protein [Flavobacterium sp.]HRZ73387.1 ATP-binding protein [Flavobacterium sp.]
MEDYFNKLKKYNFWEGNVPSLGFERKTYSDAILDYTGNKLIKVLTGQRRVGKSYLLRQIADKIIKQGISAENIVYLNKEFTDFDFIGNYKELEKLIEIYRNKINPKGKIYLFIDEVQNIEGWEHFVNSYSQNYVDSYEIFISGSNSKMLSGELATLLSGRYVSFEIFPFGFSEYAQVLEKEKNKQTYIEYMESGGLPELFELPNEQTKRNYVSAIKDSVLLRDIIQRYNIKDPRLLEDIFVYLVNNASNLISINNIVNFFKSNNRKTTYDTVSNYIEYITDTFLIHKAERYDVKGKDIILGNCKYYINDLAFKNYLYQGFGYGIGYKLENLIYLELRRSGYEVFTGTIKNREIDFVAKKANRIIYLQVTYLLENEQTATREYAPLKAIPDNYEKVVVSLDDVSLPPNEGILHVQTWKLADFLK